MSKLFILLNILIIAGCDTIQGVSRYAYIGEINLPLECMVETTSLVKGVSNVEHQTEYGGRALTLTGIQKPEVIERFFYNYDGLNGNYYFVTNYKGRTDFHHTYMAINHSPPQSEIDRIQPIMIEIESLISQRCNLDLFNKATENCSGVTCDDAQ